MLQQCGEDIIQQKYFRAGVQHIVNNDLFSDILNLINTWEALLTGTCHGRRHIMIVRIFACALVSVLLTLALGACGGGGTATPPSMIGFPPSSGGTPPAAPTAITPVAGNGQVTLSWPAVTDATTYNVYFSTTSGVTTASLTNVKGITATSRTVTGLTNDTTYFFVVTAVNVKGESGISSEVFATPVLFQQSDLAGTWNFTIFATGPEVTSPPGSLPGWARGTLTIDSAGNVSPSSMTYLDSKGINLPPTATGTLIERVDSSGVVTESGTAVVSIPTQPFFNVPLNSAKLSSNKNWIVGVSNAGPTGSTNSRVIRIFQRQGVAFSSSNLTAFSPFVFHQLNSGASSEWRFGTGTINALNQLTLSILNGPSGAQTLPPPNFETLAIGPTGIISATSNGPINPTIATFQGVMSADKTVIIATQTDTSGVTPIYNLQIFQATGQNYILSDLAGDLAVSNLVSSATPLAQFGTATIDSTGNGSVLFTGASTSSPVGFTMDTLFNVLMPADPSFNGFLSFNKDLMVSISTVTPASATTPGTFNLSLWVR
jgi:hypothetical protein